MSISLSTMAGRVKKNKPSKVFRRHNYRDALKYLLRDFEDRCAYSMVHNSNNTATMEVDHFNPLLSGSARHDYENLMPSIRHCNGKKHQFWPSSAEVKLGVRFLNPAKEQDYGIHIFEDPDTNKLVGVTPAGKYHIRILDLNADFLISMRKDRAAFIRILKSPATFTGNWDNESVAAAKELLGRFQDFVDRSIPEIPPPPI